MLIQLKKWQAESGPAPHRARNFFGPLVVYTYIGDFMKQALEEHPTVRLYREKETVNRNKSTDLLDSDWLRDVCLKAGADDVGFVEISRPELDADRTDILSTFPGTKVLISIVRRANRDPIRSPARSIANTEFHQATDQVNEICRKIVTEMEKKGIRALNPAAGFPMEMDRWGGKIWIVSHKLVAVAAGLGEMGIHRNVIHPKFGSFILLGTVLVDAELTGYSNPIDYNPCLECKLCVAACPTGAIGADGHFNFFACSTHNYREFMGGFVNWVETVTNSKDAGEYRKNINDSETVSLWQSLSFGANYKAAYCVAVCPAGEDVIGPFLNNRPKFLQDIVKPLQEKTETIYVVPNSDAETHVAKRFPNKITKRVGNGLRIGSIRQFLNGLSLTFQREKARDFNARYHFSFTGEERRDATILIENKTLKVEDGLIGTPDLHVTADSRTWVNFLNKEKNIVVALLSRKLRLKGSPRLLLKFSRCFPS
jgi:NAD-dependent dihydropyrimidine dehydrogenase PreA subunit